MKTIGLIGGMSWESTASYYRLINETVKQRLGGLHSAKLCLYSLDFAEIEAYQHAGEWSKSAAILSQAARSLEKAGAECVLICTNTMHIVAPLVEKVINIPLIHIADPTAEKIKHSGIKQIALLGTAFTMEKDFYKGRLKDKYQLDVLIPDDNDRKLIHHIIYNELCLGQIKENSRQHYLHIIDKLVAQGAEGVILGCTEIALLVEPQYTSIKLFDTTEIHALAAIDWALAD